MSCLILSTVEGLVILGDLTPCQNGVISCTGYGWKWFAGELSEDYLCGKFLTKEFVPEEAYFNFRERILMYRRDGSISKEKAREAFDANEEHGPKHDQWTSHEFYETFTEYFDYDGEGWGYNLGDAGWLCAIQQKFSELMAKAQEEKKYYIVCTRHSFGGSIGFWGPNERGYSVDLAAAGKYTAEQARTIHEDCKHIDFAVPCEVVEKAAKQFTSVYGEVQADWKKQYAKPWAEVFGAEA